MTDYLLNISRNPLAKSLVKRFKLPVPLPQPLNRPKGPWPEAPLAGKTFAIGTAADNQQRDSTVLLRRTIEQAGGRITELANDQAPLTGVVFDASTIATTADLEHLYGFVKPQLARLAPSGRVVIIGTNDQACRTASQAAAQGALAGFVKSLGRELGRRGATAQLLTVQPGSGTTSALYDAARLALPLTFILSDASAFISGQTINITDIVEAAQPTSAANDQATKPWHQPLAGKIALVTGAAQGIGAKIAAKLAGEGARVVGIDRPGAQAPLEHLMQSIGGTPWLIDLLDPTAVPTIVHRAETEFGAIDILVNNAGITRDKTLARMPRDYWTDTLALNLSVPIALTEALTLGDATLFRLLNPGGRIIFLSSISGIGGNAGQCNYAAAKAGLIAYAGALAPRVAAKGITVNALAPGFIETEMTDRIPVGTRELARRMNALNQAGSPDDVAEAAAFLASPGAYGITGSVLRVCGLNILGA